MDASIVPVIDFSVTDEATLVKVMQSALRTVGFCYVSNHGVPEALMNDALSMSKAYFALPEDVKRRCLATEDAPYGLTPLQSEKLDPTNTGGDIKEGYYIRRELADHEQENVLEKRKANKWPDESQSADMAGWRSTMETYFAAAHQLGLRLMRLIALALEIEPTFFDARFDRALACLRLLHYPGVVSHPHDGVIGCGAHSDYGVITVLLTDSTPGLEVLVVQRPDRSVTSADRKADRPEECEWVPVPPMPGALIVNFGDMLQRWTNDLVRSTVHRVVNREGKERYSIPFFMEPNFDVVVDCFESCKSADRPQRYPPTTSGQYLLDRYMATYGE